MLDVANAPSELHRLIPIAERLGIIDDVDHEHAVHAATSEEMAEIKLAVSNHETELERWLAGPDAAGPSFTRE